jgi:hypothetical protein
VTFKGAEREAASFAATVQTAFEDQAGKDINTTLVYSQLSHIDRRVFRRNLK